MCWRQPLRLNLFLIFTTTAISGCVSPEVRHTPEDPALTLLLAVADSVKDETNRFFRAQRPTDLRESKTPIDPRLNAMVNNVDYTGPATHLLQELANRAGYKFFVYGEGWVTGRKNGSIARTIIVQSSRASIYELVQEVRAQLGGSAKVTVLQNKKSIELEILKWI